MLLGSKELLPGLTTGSGMGTGWPMLADAIASAWAASAAARAVNCAVVGGEWLAGIAAG